MSDSKIVRMRSRVINDVLINPHIGFTTFQRFNGDALNEGRRWTEGFPIEYQPFDGNLENKNHPMTSVAYFRVYWKFVEPKDGEYNWDMIDKALNTAHSRKQTLMLRIAPYGDKPGTELPDWFEEIIGPVDINKMPHKWWRVDHNGEPYLYYFTRMVRALGARYDKNPYLDSVDLSIIGPWGEGMASKLLTQEARETLVDAYLESFTQTPLMMLLTDDKTNQYGISRANVGWRVDCLGDMGRCWQEGQGEWSHMLDWYPHLIIRTGMTDAWKKAPVSFEACGVMQHWLDRYWDVDYIIDQSLKWHISTFNAKSSAVPEVWVPNVERWLKKMGYRFALRTITYPAEVNPGGQMSYSIWLENQGVAPSYRPYPVALRIANERTKVVFMLDADIRTWLPGDVLLEGDVSVPQDLPQGNYELQVAILNKEKTEPIIQLANEGRRPDGWYRIGDIKVGERIDS
jgi:hypothetical protein